MHIDISIIYKYVYIFGREKGRKKDLSSVHSPNGSNIPRLDNLMLEPGAPSGFPVLVAGAQELESSLPDSRMH